MKIIFILATLCVQFVLLGQTGGNFGYQQLNQVFDARSLGLGADFITVRDGDPLIGLNNPALLNKSSHRKIGFGQLLLPSGVNLGSIAFARTCGTFSTLSHLRYVAYGGIKRTSESGEELGSFFAGDFIIGGSASKEINERMVIGTTLNVLYSQLESYWSMGMSLDVAGAYFNSEKEFLITGLVKNLGMQFKSFSGARDLLPIELQFGISKKLAHAPFRFSLVAQNLQKWDLSYNVPGAKPTIDPISGDTIPVPKDNFLQKGFRHAKLQTELLFGKKVHLRIAFDYNRRREMALSSRPGLAGFSFGMGIYLKRFSIDYGWMIYSSAGGQQGLSINIPLGNSIKKR